MLHVWSGRIAALVSVATLVGCAGAPASTPSTPTISAAATQAAAAVKPAVSPAATAVAAAASPAATAIAAASPADGAAVAAASPAAATAVAASPLRITAVQLSPTDSLITVQNTSGAAVSLSGWKLQVGTASATLPSAAQVAPNDSLTIHTASGTSAGKDVYLGQDAATLLTGLRPGAKVALLDAQGASVTEFTLPG
jgi:hypothetical protein